MIDNLKLRLLNSPEWIISICVFLVYWLVNKSYTGPAYLTDEIGYLANAALISGHFIDGASSYHAGYSFFLAPLFSFFSDPSHIWQAAMVLNALIWSISFLLLTRILRKLLPDLNNRQVSATLFISAVYPAWITMSGYVFATTAFVFVYLLAILTFLYWKPSKYWTIIPHCLVAGYLYWIHPVGLAVCIASFVSVSFVSHRKKRYASLLLSFVLIVFLIISYREVVDKWLVMLATPYGYDPLYKHYPDSERIISKIFLHDFWLHVLVKSAGQISYLIISSFGLILFGFIASIKNAYILVQKSNSFNDKNVVKQSTYAFLILSLLGVLAMGVIFFSGSVTRIDQWIYGRYIEMVVLPFIALGYLSFWSKKWLFGSALFVIITGLILYQFVDMEAPNNLVNTIPFWPQYVFWDKNILYWMIAGSLGLVFVNSVRKISKFGNVLGITCVVMLFIFSAVFSSFFHHSRLSVFNTPSTFVNIIRENYPPGICVGFNLEGFDYFHAPERQRYNLHLFYLYDYAYRRMSPEEWLNNCNGLYFTYNIDGLYEEHGVKLIGKEVFSKIFLLAKDDGSTIAMPDIPKTVRDIYTVTSWSINYTISCDGSQLSELSGPAGYYEDGSIYSTGTDGVLLLDPHKRLGSGKYNFVLWGEASVADGSLADIVSKGGRTEHAKFDVRDNPESNNAVIASGAFILDEPAPNLEVRVCVNSTDNIRIDGYLIEYISGVKE